MSILPNSYGLQCSDYLLRYLAALPLAYDLFKGKARMSLFTKDLKIWNSDTQYKLNEEMCARPMAEWPAGLNSFSPLESVLCVDSPGQGPESIVTHVAACASCRPSPTEHLLSERPLHLPLCGKFLMGNT